MPYSFILRQEATREFIDAYAWYEEQQEGLGIQFRTEFQNKIKLICNNPLHYKKAYKKFHEALLSRFPFLIIYLVDDKINQIIIVAIFHTSRDPKSKFRK